MDGDRDKFEDFDTLDEETAEALSEAEPALDLEGTAPEEEATEDLEPIMDEAPEMVFSKEAQEAKEQEVLVKYCLFCREIIPAEAIACKHCGHVVHIFEGAVFKQLYWFLWGGVLALVGSFLPFFNGDTSPLVPATHTFAGALYLIFALILLVAMAMSIYSKRLIMSPVFLMFIPAAHTWVAVIQQVGRIENPDFSWYNLFYKIDAINLLADRVGSGFLMIWIGSTLVALTFIFSIVSALSGGGKNTSEGRARAPSKGKGRRR